MTLFCISHETERENPIYCHAFILSKRDVVEKVSTTEDFGVALAKGLVELVSILDEPDGLVSVYVEKDTEITWYIEAKAQEY